MASLNHHTIASPSCWVVEWNGCLITFRFMILTIFLSLSLSFGQDPFGTLPTSLLSISLFSHSFDFSNYRSHILTQPLSLSLSLQVTSAPTLPCNPNFSFLNQIFMCNLLLCVINLGLVVVFWDYVFRVTTN